MSIPVFPKFVCVLVLASLGIVTAACNTTKATSDTTVKFFSSTSPDSLFTGDGMVKPEHKVDLFAGVAFENIQQDVARGGGSYVASLATLLNVPENERETFGRFVQDRYPLLFVSGLREDHAAHLKFVSSLKREMDAGVLVARPD